MSLGFGAWGFWGLRGLGWTRTDTFGQQAASERLQHSNSHTHASTAQTRPDLTSQAPDSDRASLAISSFPNLLAKSEAPPLEFRMWRGLAVRDAKRIRLVGILCES